MGSPSAGAKPLLSWVPRISNLGMGTKTTLKASLKFAMRNIDTGVSMNRCGKQGYQIPGQNVGTRNLGTKKSLKDQIEQLDFSLSRGHNVFSSDTKERMIEHIKAVTS